MMYFMHVFVIGLVLSWPSSHALQAGGPVRIAKGRRSSSSTVSGSSEGSRSRKGHTRKGRGGGGAGGGELGRSSLPKQDRSFDRYRFSVHSNDRIHAGTGQRKATFRKLKKGGSMSMMARLRRKVRKFQFPFLLALLQSTSPKKYLCTCSILERVSSPTLF